MTVRKYLVGVDWNNDNDPANNGDDVTSDVLADDDLIVEWGRDSTQAPATQPGAGSFNFSLRNDLGRYSPENVSSDLHGKILPGRRVQFMQLDTPHVKLFDGVLDRFQADRKAFVGSALDAWGRPGGEQLSTPLYRGLRTGDAVNLVLDAIGWTGDRAIDPGVTVMPWWWEEGTDAATAIEKLVDSEGPPAIAYVQGGVFIFEDRHHRLFSAASQTSAGTYTYIVPAGSGPAGDFKVLKDSFAYDHGLFNVVNQVMFDVEERAPQQDDEVEIWSSDERINLASGETLTITAGADDPFMGAEVTSVVASGSPAISLSRDSGQSTLITIVASGVTVITRLAVLATPVPVTRTVKVSKQDTSSIGIMGIQPWDRTVPWCNRYDADAIARRIVAAYATNRPRVTFTITNLDPTYLKQIRERRISDRITVRNDQLGINNDFIIEKITHEVRKFLIHKMTLVCEVPPPVQPTNLFTFDVAGKGFDDGKFGVSGIDSAANAFLFDGGVGHRFDEGVFTT